MEIAIIERNVNGNSNGTPQLLKAVRSLKEYDSKKEEKSQPISPHQTLKLQFFNYMILIAKHEIFLIHHYCKPKNSIALNLHLPSSFLLNS